MAVLFFFSFCFCAGEVRGQDNSLSMTAPHAFLCLFDSTQQVLRDWELPSDSNAVADFPDTEECQVVFLLRANSLKTLEFVDFTSAAHVNLLS